MKHLIARLSLAVASALAGVVLAQDGSAPPGASRAGLAEPAEVIAARRALMLEAERLMQPIDGYAAGDAHESEAIRAAAGEIATLLEALPRLFPATTNRYDATAETPETLAMPAIWQDFESFSALAESAVTAASAAAATSEPEALRQAALRLRGSCDACHAPFLRPYAPAEVSSEDLEFDFESVLPQD